MNSVQSNQHWCKWMSCHQFFLPGLLCYHPSLLSSHPLTWASHSVLWLDNFDDIATWLQTSSLSYFLIALSIWFITLCPTFSVTSHWPPAGNPLHLSSFFVVVVVAHLGMWDLSSLARGQTHSPCIVGSVLTTGPRGKSLSLFWMYIFRFCVHILCSSISFNRDPPPLYFHLEIPLVFQGLTQTPPPFWSFPWSFSEGLPFPSADLCFFLMQIPCFYSVMCSCWELIRLCLHRWVVPCRVEAPSLFIEWMIVSWSLRKTMKEGCSKPRSRW